jgi:hypothetical protein
VSNNLPKIHTETVACPEGFRVYLYCETCKDYISPRRMPSHALSEAHAKKKATP